ncbi:MAG: hypothetical protein M3Q07_08590, partial [Pseudobdellovibrionaceae bacterium]|nr:hypothetical protein [Pseudobdellovibrionaceae bacterium]
MNWVFSSSGVPSAPFPVFRLDAFWAYEAPDGLLAVAGKLPWGQLPSFLTNLAYPRIHYTAFRGWSDDLWYDGPLFYGADGAVQSCVLPGSGAQLPTSTQNGAEGFAQWLVDREVLAWKKSLAWAFRERLTLPHGAYILQHLQC